MIKTSTQKKIVTQNYNDIVDYLSDKSAAMTKYLKDHPDGDYLMFTKYITHSDLISKGKRKENEGYEKNLLYYLTADEMGKINQVEDELSVIRTTSTAHQTCISLANDVYKFLDLPYRKNNESFPQTVLNDYVKIYTVNDSLKYFDLSYTKKIFDKLGKKADWDFNENLKLNKKSEFTELHLTQAAHGPGTNDDELFQTIRKSLFLNDRIIVICNKKNKEMFFVFVKNSKFFSLLGMTSDTWSEFVKNETIKSTRKLTMDLHASSDELDRSLQQRWKDILAEEMMNYTGKDNYIICPLTYVEADYKKVGTLFRASHIKGHKTCANNVESYDINNGILMTANADALFDKHLITIDDDGEIIFSYLLANEVKLQNDLSLLNHKVLPAIMTDKRKKMLSIHRAEFYEKENKRKKGQLCEDEDID